MDADIKATYFLLLAGGILKQHDGRLYVHYPDLNGRPLSINALRQKELLEKYGVFEQYDEKSISTFSLNYGPYNFFK